MNDWYETVKINYGLDYYAGRVGHFNPIPNTWSKMTDILLFWARKGVDGFRCDMAEMVPAEFWHWATDKLKFAYPDLIFIGEVYNPAEYRNYLGAGFDYLYDKVGMYDTVRDVICGHQSTMPSRVPGSRLMTSATTCSISSRTTTNSVWPAVSLLEMDGRACRDSSSQPCFSRIP